MDMDMNMEGGWSDLDDMSSDGSISEGDEELVNGIDGGSDEEDESEADEEIDIETLIEAGMVKPDAGASKRTNKGKNNSGTEVGRGHVIFKDDEAECK